MASGRFRKLIALFAALAIIASACGGGSDGESSGSDNAADTSGDTSTDTGDTEPDIDEASGVDQTADGTDLQADDDATAQAGGVLRIGAEADPATLNPASAPFAATANLMGYALFESLTHWTPDAQWVNNLSESWTPNDDFTSWDMKLRPGIMFSDGTPLNADAVLRNLEEQRGAALLQLFIGTVLGEPAEKIDDLTVRVHANGPNSILPAYFASQVGMMASPAWYDSLEANPENAQMPVGAGPFVMESRVQDSVTRLVRNDNWWRTDQEIYLDAVEIYPNNQEVTRTEQFLGEDLEMVHVTDVDSITALREAEGVARFEDSQEEFFLIFNAGKAPFDDIRVRQAATHAYNHADYGSLITKGVSVPSETLFTSDSFWHVDDIEQLHDQPDLAAPLIDAYCGENPANCTDGKVNIEYQNNGPSLVLEQIKDVIEQGWGDYFNIEHQVIPQDEHINEVVFGQFDVATWRYHGFLDPELESAFLSCSTIGALSVNFARNCNPERDALIAEQRTVTDPEQRRAIWEEIQRDLNESRQYLILTHNIWSVAANEGVNGVCDATTADGEPLYCSLNGAWFLPQIWLDQ